MRGFARISAAVPRCGVTDFTANRDRTLALWQRADAAGSAVVLFPELGLSAYTARDLLVDHHLLERSLQVLGDLAAAGRELIPLAIVGLPLRVGSALYNVAALLQGGRVLGLVPKTHLPNHREFEERRWFRSGAEVPEGLTVELLGEQVPLGTDLLFRGDPLGDLIVGVELCEDFWVPIPPSAQQVLAGATLVCNLSASNFTVGKSELRRMLARSASDRGKCAYAYVAAGPGESSTDLSFDADAFIFENGRELVASRRFGRQDQLITVDVDLELLVHERLTTTTFADCARQHRRPFRRVSFVADEPRAPLRRAVSPHPFLPADEATLATRCWEIFEIQTHALVTRMHAAGVDRLVLGLSGGLDSTQAALVAAAALRVAGEERQQLYCVNLPGLGTSTATRDNAARLAHALGARFSELGIAETSRLVLELLGHPAATDVGSVDELLQRLRAHPELGDIPLENVQARLRTLILMTLANQERGLVVGTGDLSEKALGWATYGGDQISMYDVNAGVPKTLIQFVIRWVANERAGSWSAGEPGVLREVLFRILDTPISPELLPPDASGRIGQLTEEAIGPYELHDFFLYHLVRHGARPQRILALAGAAFESRYDRATLGHWLGVFYRRFFGNQFKRSCAADGPKVGMVSLSPRGDWRMPSDAEVASWLADIEAATGAE